MTKEEFVDILRIICNNKLHQDPRILEAQLNYGHIALPEICKSITADCFIYDIDDDTETEILKEQLKHLYDEGTFNFS